MPCHRFKRRRERPKICLSETNPAVNAPRRVPTAEVRNRQEPLGANMIRPSNCAPCRRRANTDPLMPIES